MGLFVLGALPSLAGLYSYVKTQGQTAIYIAIIIWAVSLAFKREFGKALGVALGLGFLAFAVLNPETITGWFTALANLLGG